MSSPDAVCSDYIFMYFNRPEFDRYTRFNSWGSAREAFSWNDMCSIEINLPSLAIQRKYADAYTAILGNENYRLKLGNIAPILIKGSLEEAST